MLQIGQIIRDTEAEGPGRRFAVWVQGCPLRCPGCCNPQMLPFEGGDAMTVEDLVSRAITTSGIDGVSLLGGEPFAQAGELARFAERVRGRGLGVMIYSGFTLEELNEKVAAGDGDTRALLAQCDLLVDGPYDRNLPEHGRVDGRPRRWIGSTNQRMHFLTDRYHPDDERMFEKNSVEIRLSKDGELVVNGWPALAAGIGVKPFVRLTKAKP